MTSKPKSREDPRSVCISGPPLTDPSAQVRAPGLRARPRQQQGRQHAGSAAAGRHGNRSARWRGGAERGGDHFQGPAGREPAEPKHPGQRCIYKGDKLKNSINRATPRHIYLVNRSTCQILNICMLFRPSILLRRLRPAVWKPSACLMSCCFSWWWDVER